MRFIKRLRVLFSSVMARLAFSYIMVAMLTTLLALLVIFIIAVVSIKAPQPGDYAYFAVSAITDWQLGDAREQYSQSIDVDIPEPGYTLIASRTNKVLYVTGKTACQVGDDLSTCEPELVPALPGERFVEIDGQQWAEVVIQTATGERSIAHRKIVSLQEFFTWVVPYLFDLKEPGVFPTMIIASVIAGVFSIPASLFLMWRTGRPLAKRLGKIAHASREFANGNLDVRLQDQGLDEVGQVARQFNDMADALQQNVSVLRDLAQQNAELAQKAEEAAIQTERMRISRDLHDAIAQRLFSLTVSTSSLPELIEQNQLQGVEQAKLIAQMAEQTLLDLRALLVGLRPAAVIQQGLMAALRNLCEEWGKVHRVPVDLQIVAHSDHLASSVEATVYHVAQEALNNVAKHAAASSVSVSIIEGQARLVLSVTDNGQGFASTAANGTGHRLGLISMRERAEASGGELRIESDTQRGCTVQLTVPTGGNG